MWRNAPQFAANGKQSPSGAPSPTNKVPIMCIMFACFARRQFSSSLSAGFKPGARSLRKRARRLSAARLLASVAGLFRFRLSQVVFSTAFKFFGVRFFLVASPPPGNKSREGPHPFPRLLSPPPQGGAGQQRLSASSGLRSRVFSLRARPAFNRASASGGLAFRRLFRLRLQSFFTPLRRLPVRRSRRFRGDRRPRFSAPSATLRTIASARLRAVAVAP